MGGGVRALPAHVGCGACWILGGCVSRRRLGTSLGELGGPGWGGGCPGLAGRSLPGRVEAEPQGPSSTSTRRAGREAGR